VTDLDPTRSKPAWSQRSLAAQALGAIDPLTRAVVRRSTSPRPTCAIPTTAYSSGFVYGRPTTPRCAVGGCLAMLEERGGGDAHVRSGMAAATRCSALRPATTCGAPGHVLGVAHWLTHGTTRGGSGRLSSRPMTSSLARAVRPGTSCLDRDALERALDRDRHRGQRHRACAGAPLRSIPRLIPVHTRPLTLGPMWSCTRHQGAERAFGRGAGSWPAPGATRSGRASWPTAKAAARSSGRSRPFS
jgi:cystathionine gamma-synthase